VYVLAAAAIVVLTLILPTRSRSVSDAPQQAQVAVAPKLFVQFRLEAAEASTVRLAGSFTNWQPAYELHQSAPGIWTVTLPLSLGVHDYAFVVDGERWVPDPHAPAVDDGFGGTNSRIALLSPEQPRS
jgi:1,4-alpha-glucan branching enzyme